MRAGRKRREQNIERREADRRKAAEGRRTVDVAALGDVADVATSAPEESEKEPTESVEISGTTESGTTESGTAESNDDDEELQRDAIEEAAIEEAKPQMAEGSDLETLAQQLEKSLAGGARDASSSSGAVAPPPPEMKATPEDILGVPTQSAVFEDDKSEEPEPAAAAADVPNIGGRAAPMEEYEERAAMAKEVLRATSDHPKGLRRQSKETGEGHQASADDTEPRHEREQDVRFSEDLTISSRKSRRRLFKR